MVILKSTLQNQSRAALKLLKNHNGDDYQFLQHSKIPTYHFQSALPRLPVPKLEQTCERYLSAQRPLLVEEMYRKTESRVKTFQDGVGKQIQQLLLEYNDKNKHTSYITDMWFDLYLRARTPLPLNYNPVLVLNNDPRPEYNKQLIRTTNLIVSSLRFYKTLKAEILEPEVYHLNSKKSDTEQFRNILSKLPPLLAYAGAYLYKAFPLDMSQYHNLFSTTRIPEIDKDRIVSSDNPRHITVQYKGRFYSLDVLSDGGDILSPSHIMDRIKFILEQGSDKVEDFEIGVLTTQERNKWATIRRDLNENGNQDTLKSVDSSLFHVCLDTEEVGNDPYKIIKLFLHADGTNRWFDKSFSLLISKDGVAAVNFEHSWGDGVAVLRYSKEIFADSTKNPQVDPSTPSNAKAPVKLQFNLNDRLKSAIKEAKLEYDAICNNLEVNYTIFEGIGKDTCKRNKVSPDAVMQLAFQVAYHKMNGGFVPTYESCSTAAFKHGRTEAIRPCTMATKEFTLALNSERNKPSVAELKKMIFDCSEIHNRLIKEAAMGQGFDRHLFALRTLGEKNGIEGDIFRDPEYAHMNHNVLSTSTLNSPALFAGGFGPVVKDGFGLGYAIKDEFLGVLATNYRDASDGKAFISALTKSFEEIFAILQAN